MSIKLAEVSHTWFYGRYRLPSSYIPVGSPAVTFGPSLPFVTETSSEGTLISFNISNISGQRGRVYDSSFRIDVMLAPPEIVGVNTSEIVIGRSALAIGLRQEINTRNEFHI